MVKKPSGGWDRVQVNEWAFSVAALHWNPDLYWQVSRFEFLEIRNAWYKLNGIDTRSEEQMQTAAESERISRLRTSLTKPITLKPHG